MSTTALATAAVAKKALENVVDDLYSLGKGKLRAHFKRWKAKGKIDTLYKKLKNVRFVKTIWQAEREVDLASFYYPIKIKIDNKRTTIHDISDFDYDGNIIVQGTAGQGKSIFFRYLTAIELAKGNAIPLFVELRRLGKTRTLLAHLLKEIKVLGLDVDRPTFHFLAKNGKIVLFLDGIDEVKEGNRTELITEIENLTKQFESLRVFITSRPHSGIANSPYFRVFKLSPLLEKEYEGVIRRQSVSKEIADSIISGVNKSNIKKLLTTPLMVALLVIRYRADATIPENAVAFFDQLFSLLLHRHDKLKAGYRRPRKSGLSETALLEVFESLCFLTRKFQQDDFNRRALRSYAKEALRVTGHRATPDRVIDDIVDITCLILEESDECRFVHKSVQEFHAACFVKNQPDPTAVNFYEAMKERWDIWQNELVFLSWIDKYRYLKWFHIPEVRRALNLKAGALPAKWQATTEVLVHAFGDVVLGTMYNAAAVAHSCISGSRPLADILGELSTLAYEEPVVKNAIEKCKIPPTELPEGFDEVAKRGMPFCRMADIFRLQHVGNVLVDKLDSSFREVIDAQRYVEQIEARRSMFDF